MQSSGAYQVGLLPDDGTAAFHHIDVSKRNANTEEDTSALIIDYLDSVVLYHAFTSPVKLFIGWQCSYVCTLQRIPSIKPNNTNDARLPSNPTSRR